MKTITLLVRVLAVLALAEGICHNYEKTYYEELGCTPQPASGSECPTSYDCSTLMQRRQDKCHFKGRMFDLGYKLEDSPSTSCFADCRCRKDTENRAMFSCISIECPEYFNGPPEPGCYRTYKHGQCCHVEDICDGQAQGEESASGMSKVVMVEQKARPEVCQYHGEVYRVGQKFYPDEEPCMRCICQPGFNGSLVTPFCERVACHLELLDGARIAEGCAPVFYGHKGCCPIDWRCPEDTDFVLPISKKPAAKQGNVKTCTFGKVVMQIGEQLSPSSELTEGVTCECRVPPHPVCIQRENNNWQ